MNRREFFRQFLGAALDKAQQSRAVRAVQGAVDHVRRVTEAPRSPHRPIRPPGALDETEFRQKCHGCAQECVRSCPVQAIALDDEHFPRLNPERRPCVMCEGLRCISACPTGALRPVGDFWRIAAPSVDEPACLSSITDPCTACLNICPLGERAIGMTLRGKPAIHREACTGCGQCAAVCPANPKAILLLPALERFVASPSM